MPAPTGAPNPDRSINSRARPRADVTLERAQRPRLRGNQRLRLPRLARPLLPARAAPAEVARVRERALRLHRAQRHLLQPEEPGRLPAVGGGDPPRGLRLRGEGEPLHHPQPQAAPRRARAGQPLRERHPRPGAQDGSLPLAAPRHLPLRPRADPYLRAAAPALEHGGGRAGPRPRPARGGAPRGGGGARALSARRGGAPSLLLPPGVLRPPAWGRPRLRHRGHGGPMDPGRGGDGVLRVRAPARLTHPLRQRLHGRGARVLGGTRAPMVGGRPRRLRLLRQRPPRLRGARRDRAGAALPRRGGRAHPFARRPRARRRRGGRYHTSAPPSARRPGTSTSAAPPFLNVRRSVELVPSRRASRPETSGSCPTIATTFSRACLSSAAATCSKLPPARAGSSWGSTWPQASAAMSAVWRARTSGLVKSTSGRRQTRARPRAASSNRRRPRAVRGRSSSGTLGVPWATAMAWRMITSRMGVAPSRR